MFGAAFSLRQAKDRRPITDEIGRLHKLAPSVRPSLAFYTFAGGSQLVQWGCYNNVLRLSVISRAGPCGQSGLIDFQLKIVILVRPIGRRRIEGERIKRLRLIETFPD